MKKRTIALMMAVVMLFGVAIGGTIAWLTAQSQEVVNTFTVGDINIELYETDVDNSNSSSDSRDTSNTYQLIPGTKYVKDPKVTVKGAENSVDCYLFVKFVPRDSANYLDYTSMLTVESEKWIKLTTADGCSAEDGDVWYREVSASTSDQSWQLLAGEGEGEYKNGFVSVKETVVKNGTDVSSNSSLVEMPQEAQTMTWTAYAVQKDNLTVAQAWDKVDPTP